MSIVPNIRRLVSGNYQLYIRRNGMKPYMYTSSSLDKCIEMKEAFLRTEEEAKLRAEKKRLIEQTTKLHATTEVTQLHYTKKTKRQVIKQFFVDEFGGACKHCGGKYPAYVYDFHHVNPSEKETSLGAILNCSIERIRKELSKCIMLCATCHRLVHGGDNG